MYSNIFCFSAFYRRVQHVFRNRQMYLCSGRMTEIITTEREITTIEQRIGVAVSRSTSDFETFTFIQSNCLFSARRMVPGSRNMRGVFFEALWQKLCCKDAQIVVSVSHKQLYRFSCCGINVEPATNLITILVVPVTNVIHGGVFESKPFASVCSSCK